MNESKSNAPLGPLLTELQRQSSWLRIMRRLAALFFVVSLMLFVALLQGCASKSTLPSEPPPPVLMPALSQPMPPVSYLLSAQRDIQSWQARLKAMFQTSEL